MNDLYENEIEMPSIEELEEELQRERIRRGHSKVLRTIIMILIGIVHKIMIVGIRIVFIMPRIHIFPGIDAIFPSRFLYKFGQSFLDLKRMLDVDNSKFLHRLIYE